MAGKTQLLPAPLGLGAATPLVESGSGTPGTSTLASHQDHVHPAAGGGSITSALIKLASDDAFTTSGSWVTVTGMTLAIVASGSHTYLVFTQITFNPTDATSADAEFRLQDTTNNVTIASGEVKVGTITTYYFTIPLTSLYTVTGNFTLAIQVNSSVFNGTVTIKAATPDNGTGNNATQMGYLQLS